MIREANIPSRLDSLLLLFIIAGAGDIAGGSMNWRFIRGKGMMDPRPDSDSGAFGGGASPERGDGLSAALGHSEVNGLRRAPRPTIVICIRDGAVSPGRPRSAPLRRAAEGAVVPPDAGYGRRKRPEAISRCTVGHFHSILRMGKPPWNAAGPYGILFKVECVPLFPASVS